MMGKIWDYRIADALSIETLERIVKEAILEEGWQPVGGVFFSPEEDGFYMQAMVRRGEQ